MNYEPKQVGCEWCGKYDLFPHYVPNRNFFLCEKCFQEFINQEIEAEVTSSSFDKNIYQGLQKYSYPFYKKLLNAYQPKFLLKIKKEKDIIQLYKISEVTRKVLKESDTPRKGIFVDLYILLEKKLRKFLPGSQNEYLLGVYWFTSIYFKAFRNLKEKGITSLDVEKVKKDLVVWCFWFWTLIRDP